MTLITLLRNGLSRTPLSTAVNTITPIAGVIALTIAVAVAGQTAFQIKDENGNVVWYATGAGTQTMSGTLNLRSYNCSLKLNGGKITTTGTGQTICADDIAGAATGALIAAFDPRFVNVSGDTMTGGLLIQNGNPPGTIKVGLLLEVKGTMSGRLVTQNGAGNNYFMGNVGIGGTPSEALHVIKSTGNFSTIRFDSGNTQGYLFSYDGDNTVNFGSNSNANVNVKVNNTTRATFDSTKLAVLGSLSGQLLTVNGSTNSQNYILGNLGIGRSTARTKLEVQGAMSGNALTISGITSGLVVKITNGTTVGRTIQPGSCISVSNGNGVSGDPTITNTCPDTATSPGGSDTQVQFNDSGSFGGSANLVWLNSPGNLGIGTDAPMTQLHLKGRVPEHSLDTEATATTPYAVFVQGRYAYVAEDTVMEIFDVSDPANIPTAVGSAATTGGNPDSIFVQGHYAYVTVQNAATLDIVDVSRPSAPITVGTFSLAGNPVAVYVQGRYAYLALDGRIQIVDISDPDMPKAVAQTASTNDGRDIFVQGRYAYMLEEGKLEVFDISDPFNPTSVAAPSLCCSSGVALYVQGQYAYVMENDDVEIFDVSDPTSPSPTGNHPLASTGHDVYVQGRYAYLAETASVVETFDVGGGDTLTHVGDSTVGDANYSIFIQGRYGYLADNIGELHTVDYGGAYIQQLEAGGIEAYSMSVMNALHASDGTFDGGLTSRSLEVNGNAALRYLYSRTTDRAQAIFYGYEEVTPSANDINGSIQLGINSQERPKRGLWSYSQDSGVYFDSWGEGAAGNMRLRTGQSPNTGIFIDTSQNVGIGRESARTRLEVQGSISGSLLVINSSNTANNFIRGNLGLGKTTPRTRLEVVGTISGSTIIANVTLNSSGTLIVRKKAGSGTGNIVIIDTKGLIYDGTNKRVGIGTTAPKTALEVIGTLSGSLITQNGAGANYFLGNIGIGKTTNNAKLDVNGTMSGVALVVGGGSTVTKILSATATLDFGSTIASTCSDLTVTVTGAADGDVVSVGIPSASVPAGLTGFYAEPWVSSASTITIRYCALALSDPASGTFRVEVHKF